MKTKLLLGLLVASLLAACGGQASPDPNAVVPVVVDDFAIIADGRVAPAQSISLSFASGGRVEAVYFAEGDAVAEGALLARLESSESLAAQVANAELELLSAQQARADLDEPPDAIVTARAAYDIVQARDAVSRTEKTLRNLLNPVSEQLVDAVADAELALTTAQANLQLANVSPEVQALHEAAVAADLTFRAYQDLQAQYDESNGNLELLDAVKQAQAAYQAALDRQSALQLAIDTAQANQANAVEQAQEAYDDAVANLAAAQRGPDQERVDLAQAEVDLALANLAEAERQYAEVSAGPEADDVALADARLAAAEAALAAAHAALDDVELRAPFAGTLAQFDLKAGEQAAPGQPVGTLADFSSWWIETDNLTEIEVVRISEGQTVVVMLDALPETALQGTVATIAAVYEEKRGDITYTTRIALTGEEPRMRWGMTAEVTFDQ
jgi:HlyD family secretion protein